MEFSDIPMEEFKATSKAYAIKIFSAPEGMEDIIGELQVMLLVHGNPEDAASLSPEIVCRVALTPADINKLAQNKCLYIGLMSTQMIPIRVFHKHDGGANSVPWEEV